IGRSGRVRSPAAAWCKPTSTARKPTTAPATSSSPRTWRRASCPTTANTRRRWRRRRGYATAIRARRPPSTSAGSSRPPPTRAVRPTGGREFGRTVGMPNAGQVGALGMLNTRGERSVTCKGDFARHPSAGPRPPEAPRVGEESRRQPDALERADELDRQYGRNPDLAAMPMYCIPFAFKDPYDTKDMRSTGGADAHYDMDFPARDHTLLPQLPAKCT